MNLCSPWNPEAIAQFLAKTAKKMGVRMPQAQNLLAQERFLARLSKTEYGTKYIWKGGSLVLRAYSNLEIPRYTVDLDLLARGVPIEKTMDAFQQAASVQLGDGFVFREITKKPMQRDLPYGGDRFEIAWTLFGNQHSERLKIDVAAGDIVDPKSMTSADLFLCPEETISLLVYPPEFIAAEKLETIIRFGTGNTRVKDLIDLWTLSQLKLSKSDVQTAIKRCFKNRKTNFSLSAFESIFSDPEYRSYVADAIDRNFNALQLPEFTRLLTDLLDWIQLVSPD